MKPRVIIADYDDDRLSDLESMVITHLPGSTVTKLKTRRYVDGEKEDAVLRERLQLLANSHDLLIGHLGGNPSGFACLKVFKVNNPRGRVVLYTKSDSIPLDDLEQLKLADRVFKRSPVNSKVFPDAGQMMSVIEGVIRAPGIGYLRSRFKDPVFLTTFLSLLGAVITLIGTLIATIVKK